jgi:membrane-associated phospholipid phosphatase
VRARAARRARPHEILAAGYFALTGLFVLAFGRPLAEWWPTLLLHAALVLAFLRLLPLVSDRGWPAVARDWLPILGITLVYWEVARLNDLFTAGYHDRLILRAEAALFGTQPSVVLREALPWKPLSEYLHFGYFSYYALLPALAGTLYLQGRREAYRYALTVVLAVFFACYLVFIAYPVAGPWYVFQRPAPDQVGWLFPQLEHAVLSAAASEGAAFPSSHVAAALALWLLSWRLSPGTFRVFTFIVPALIVGTVYGGFHYAADALAGVLVGLAGYLTGPRLHRALGGDPEQAFADRPAGTRSRPV